MWITIPHNTFCFVKAFSRITGNTPGAAERHFGSAVSRFRGAVHRGSGSQSCACPTASRPPEKMICEIDFTGLAKDVPVKNRRSGAVATDAKDKIQKISPATRSGFDEGNG